MTVEISTQPSRTLYLDEVKLQPENKIFDQLTLDAKRLTCATLGGFMGPCELARNPDIYPLLADVNYSDPDAPALRIFSSAEDQIMFPGLTPSHLATVLGKAIDELKSH